MRRRVIAESRTKSDENTRRPDNRRTIYDTVDTASRNWSHSKQQQLLELKKKKAQQNRKTNHDREKIVFMVLVISVSALVVIACLRFNVISMTTDRRFTKEIRLQSNTTSDQESRRDRKTTDSIAIEKTSLFFDHKFIDEAYVSPNDSFRFEMEGFDGYAYDDDGGEDYYYRFDDDYERNPFTEERWITKEHEYLDWIEEGYVYHHQDDDYDEEEFCCRRISEHRYSFPNCNTFHETPILESEASIIGNNEGGYRQAMKIELSVGQEKETIILKDNHLRLPLDEEHYEFGRMDAIVAERLTASPRIYNIHGYCGIGIMSEFYENGHVEAAALQLSDDFVVTHNETGPLICYNDLPAKRKLTLSLQMAEALADLHGYPGGAIVHSDVKLDQFFFSNDKSNVILNDFNRAEFLLWDECNERYCWYDNGYGGGNWRAPEEYVDGFLDERLDVYSFGNNMYALLTGAMPFQGEEYSDIMDYVADGEQPFVDPRYKERSLEEAKLVEIIEWCHEFYPHDRPSIFEVVDFLRDALLEIENDKEKE